MVEALTLLIAAPVISSLVGFLAGRSERSSTLVITAGTGLSLALSLIIWRESARTGFARAPLLAGESHPLTAMVLVYSNFIAFLAAVYNAGLGPQGRLSLSLYNLFFLLLVFSFNYMVVARDALLLFFLVEALIGITVALVGHSPRSDAPEVAFRFLVVTTLSAFCVLVGAALLAVSRGTYSLNPVDAATGDALLLLAAILFTIGLGADIGLFPFHVWVPDAFLASTPIVNVLSCAEHTPLFVGLYNLLLAASTGHAGELVPLLLALGFSAVPLSYLLALRQEDPLRMFAYYAIGEYGVILTALSVAVVEPSLTQVWIAYALNSSLMKAGMLACLGLATSEEVWSRLSRRAREIVALSFAVCLFSSIGFPPFSGFHAKLHYFLLILNFFSANFSFWVGVAVVLTILTLSLISLYFFVTMFHNLFLSRLEGSGGGMPAQRVAALAPCPILAASAVVIGLWPQLLFPPL